MEDGLETLLGDVLKAKVLSGCNDVEALEKGKFFSYAKEFIGVVFVDGPLGEPCCTGIEPLGKGKGGLIFLKGFKDEGVELWREKSEAFESCSANADFCSDGGIFFAIGEPAPEAIGGSHGEEGLKVLVEELFAVFWGCIVVFEEKEGIYFGKGLFGAVVRVVELFF